MRMWRGLWIEKNRNAVLSTPKEVILTPGNVMYGLLAAFFAFIIFLISGNITEVRWFYDVADFCWKPGRLQLLVSLQQENLMIYVWYFADPSDQPGPATDSGLQLLLSAKVWTLGDWGLKFSGHRMRLQCYTGIVELSSSGWNLQLFDWFQVGSLKLRWPDRRTIVVCRKLKTWKV